jgi:hypothetical protein
LSAITTEGDEVEVAVSVVMLETPGHGSRLIERDAGCCDGFPYEER